MLFDPVVLLRGFSNFFNFAQSIIFFQLIMVFLFCSVLFGFILLNKTSWINLSEKNAKTITIVVCCLVFPALLAGAGVILTDILLFPYLFRAIWV